MIVSVGQFLATIRSGSYQEDDSSFLHSGHSGANPSASVRVELTKAEKCILFHLTGCIIHKVTKSASICEKCKNCNLTQ